MANQRRDARMKYVPYVLLATTIALALILYNVFDIDRLTTASLLALILVAAVYAIVRLSMRLLKGIR